LVFLTFPLVYGDDDTIPPIGRNPSWEPYFEEEFVKGFAYRAIGTLEQFVRNAIRSCSRSVLKAS
jgi:hypothetical protein